MKKFLPFVFPVVALCVVVFLAMRWYNTKAIHSSEKIADFGDIKVEDFSIPGSATPRPMAADAKSVKLTGNDGQGTVRYEVVNGKVEMSLSADLPEMRSGMYQVWLQRPNSQERKKAFVLELGKGGYMGSGATDAQVLPVDVLVSKEMQNDASMEAVLFMGTIPAEGTR